MVKHKIPISPERFKQLEHLEQYENAIITIAVISKQLIDKMFDLHKELNVNFNSVNEKLAWKKIKDGASTLDYIAFSSEHCDYEKFKKGVNIVKFLILELIAKCNDSSMRAWQFHNLLKTFPTIYPAIAPTIEDEQQAFANLFDTSAKQS